MSFFVLFPRVHHHFGSQTVVAIAHQPVHKWESIAHLSTTRSKVTFIFSQCSYHSFLAPVFIVISIRSAWLCMFCVFSKGITTFSRINIASQALCDVCFYDVRNSQFQNGYFIFFYSLFRIPLQTGDCIITPATDKRIWISFSNLMIMWKRGTQIRECGEHFFENVRHSKFIFNFMVSWFQMIITKLEFLWESQLKIPAPYKPS